jgi:DNA-binding LytR/AlgR family response regulator
MNEFCLRCLVVDDEAPAHAILKNFIGQVEALEFVDSAYNAIEATNILHREKIDLIFLDINMPRMTGLEMLESLSKAPKVILTTAYSEYALKSYDLGVVDYLMKPISFARFLKAVNKVIEQERTVGKIQETPTKVEEIKALPIENESSNPDTKANPSIWVKTDKGLYRVDYQDIAYFQSVGNYLRIALKNGETHLTLQTSKDLEQQLPSETFVRIHKSHVVNLDCLTRIDGGRVFLGKTELPIGAMFRKDFLKLVG